MNVDITLKNYRCFLAPASIAIRPGFTALVGVNNAGKSAFLRFFLEFRQLFETLKSRTSISQSISSVAGFGNLLHVADNTEVFSNRNDRPLSITLSLTAQPEDNVDFSTCRYVITMSRGRVGFQTTIAVDDVELPAGDFEGDEPAKYLRFKQRRLDTESLAVATGLANSLYIGAFRNTIALGDAGGDYFDIKTGAQFIKQFCEYKLGNNKAANQTILDVTEQIRSIFGFGSLDIAPSLGNDSLHLTINGKAYKQHELGSGLMHFIVVLANAAMRKPNWIFIDEPETNLHPALQLEFLTALGSHTSAGVMFSTHSIGLARTAAERIYSVEKRDEGDSRIASLESTPRLSEFLGEMSFAAHRELGFEKLLLVEGPTDVKVFRHFLRLIEKDHKIVLLPLHGAFPDGDELDETLRIAASVATIIDSERNAEGDKLEDKRQRFLDLCRKRGIQASALTRRAIENYFPEEALRKAFGEKHRALAPYERLKDASPTWSKSQNWRAASAMDFASIAQTDLGQFLTSL
jgi:predicted ATPase